MYRRIFNVPSFRRWTMVCGLFTIAWLIAAEVASVFTCLPMPDFWNTGFCVDYSVFFLVIEILETIGDAILLVLPIHMISTLQLSMRNKITVSFIFLLGGLYAIRVFPKPCTQS